MVGCYNVHGNCLGLVMSSVPLSVTRLPSPRRVRLEALQERCEGETGVMQNQRRGEYNPVLLRIRGDCLLMFSMLLSHRKNASGSTPQKTGRQIPQGKRGNFGRNDRGCSDLPWPRPVPLTGVMRINLTRERMHGIPERLRAGRTPDAEKQE